MSMNAHRYKMIVQWDNGSYEGFVGSGYNEESARANVINFIITIADSRRQGFKMIEHYNMNQLSPRDQDNVNADFNAEIRRLNRIDQW